MSNQAITTTKRSRKVCTCGAKKHHHPTCPRWEPASK